MLNGAGGTDTLSISISGTNTANVTTSALTLSNVENVSVVNYQTDDAFDNIINLAQATGVQNIAVTASAASGDTQFTSVLGLVSAEMSNGAGDLSISYADSVVAGTADVQSLKLSGQTGGGFTVGATSTGGVETIAINSTTSANTVSVTSSTATAITVTGDQKLTLTEGMSNTLTSVDASALTGQFVFTHNEATAIAIKGGSGNDTITFSADNFSVADTVDGGSGTDTLSLATTIASAAALANVTNVEVLKLTGGADLTLAANVAPTTFTTDDGTSVVTLNSGYTNATTVNLGVTGQVVNSANVALTVNATAANMLSGADITVTGGTGTDTLNITTGTAEDIVFASRITLVDAVNIVDKGDATSGATAKGADIKLSLGNYATSLTIDGSALDAGTVTSGVMGADDETLHVDGASVATATVVLNVTGGAGADTLVGGAGNDILKGGAGNDSINGSAGGNDSINGGDGDDIINMGSALTAADTIDGGAGNDTLIVTALSSAALANVTNIETLAFNGSGTLTSNLSFTTVDLSNGTLTDTLVFSSGYTNATTVVTDAGDVVTNNANIALTVNFNSDDVVTVTGGTGTDTLNITASSSTVATSGKITGVEVINVVDFGDDASTGTKPAGEDITIDLASYATALKIDASALDAGTVTNGSMNADFENLTITGTSAKTLTVIGGGGADTIIGSSDAAAGDSLSGGDGNDTFTMAGNLTYQDTIVGGAGTDTMTVTSAVTDVDFMNVSGVEVLTTGHGAGTATLGSYFNAAGIASVRFGTTAAALISAAGAANGINFQGTAALDTSIVGGMGNDTFTFNDVSTLTATDSINGGAGTDTIAISNAAASVTATVDFDFVTNVEQMTLGTASGLASTSAETIALTIAGITATTAQTIVINGSVISDSKDTINITNSASSSTTKFNITGGAGADTLAGSTGADTISGGDGADVITGNAGVDSLTGGAGNDVFAYAALTDSKVSGADTISDFATGADTVRITHTVAAGTTFDGTNKGTATSNSEALSLLSGSAGTTTSRVGQYYFNTTTGQMILDADGNGLIQSDDFAITMTGMTAIGAADVAFVLTDSTGAETITTGGANDTINLTDTTANQADSVNAGAGDDTINATQLRLNDTTSDTINGGTGNDTLRITGTGTVASFGSDAALVGVENIVFGTDTMVMNLANQTEALNITTANGTNSVTVGGAVAHTITGGTGDDTVSLARADLAAIGTISGGTGTDVLSINAATTALVDTDFARVASFETLQLTGASTITLGSNAQAAGIVTVLGQNTAAANNVTITSSSTLMDTVTMGSSNTGTLNVTFGDIADNTASVTAGTGNVTVVGGAAGDTITVTGLATGSQTFTGSVANFNVTGGTGAQTITTGAGADTITGGAGADTMTGGTGIDTFVLGSTSSVAATAQSVAAGAANQFDNTDTLTFGSGVDVINDFVSGTDKLDLTTAGATAVNLNGLASNTNLTAGTVYFAIGTFSGGVFTFNSAATTSTTNVATLVIDGIANTGINQTGAVILVGVAAAPLAIDII